jgi:hypothetical protein
MRCLDTMAALAQSDASGGRLVEGKKKEPA